MYYVFLTRQRKGRECDKLRRVLKPHELATLVNNFSLEQRHEFLDKQFRELEAEYRTVLERIAAS